MEGGKPEPPPYPPTFHPAPPILEHPVLRMYLTLPGGAERRRCSGRRKGSAAGKESAPPLPTTRAGRQPAGRPAGRPDRLGRRHGIFSAAGWQAAPALAAACRTAGCGGHLAAAATPAPPGCHFGRRPAGGGGWRRAMTTAARCRGGQSRQTVAATAARAARPRGHGRQHGYSPVLPGGGADTTPATSHATCRTTPPPPLELVIIADGDGGEPTDGDRSGTAEGRGGEGGPGVTLPHGLAQPAMAGGGGEQPPPLSAQTGGVEWQPRAASCWERVSVGRMAPRSPSTPHTWGCGSGRAPATRPTTRPTAGWDAAGAAVGVCAQAAPCRGAISRPSRHRDDLVVDTEERLADAAGNSQESPVRVRQSRNTAPVGGDCPCRPS